MEKFIKLQVFIFIIGVLQLFGKTKCTLFGNDSVDNLNNNQIGKYAPKHRGKRFTCPTDGKWPDPLDCGKFYNCQGGTSTSGWCGPGMSFDVDNQRCEMALAINCKDGERPDWNPPDGWEGKSTTTTTKRAIKSTTTISTPPIIPEKSYDPIKEGDQCTFKGRIADKENCANYYYCKDSELKKESCQERHLFDEEALVCKDFRQVFCNNRPVNDKGKDQCKSKPNGVYPNLEAGCSEFFQCTNQRKVKSGECPNGLKFNILTLRCDWTPNVPIPCGTKTNSGLRLNTFNAGFFESGSINSLLNCFTFILINTIFPLLLISI